MDLSNKSIDYGPDLELVIVRQFPFLYLTVYNAWYWSFIVIWCLQFFVSSVTTLYVSPGTARQPNYLLNNLLFGFIGSVTIICSPSTSTMSLYRICDNSH